jgi:broad specificity phosphatase PhoE
LRKLILIRHGNTPKNNRTPQRGLTKEGVKRIMETSKMLRKEVSGMKSCLILSTPTNRAILTADILTSELKISQRGLENLRINNLSKLAKSLDDVKLRRGNLSNYYWAISNYEEVGVESTIEFAKRVEVIISGYFEKGFECIILVTHEISLETIVRYSEMYSLMWKSYEDTSDYGDFAVMELSS